MYEALAYINFVVSFVAGTMYLRNYIRCNTIWKWLKFMHVFTLYVVAGVYLAYIFGLPVDPLIVRLNTTLLCFLFGVDAFLGRSQYGKRA